MLELEYSVSDEDLRAILESSRVIAVVGASNDHYYSSYDVTKYLIEAGYKVYPINPTIDKVAGLPSLPSLDQVPEPIDIVDVFRNPAYLDEVVDNTLTAKAQTLWTQLGVVSVDGKPEQRALAAGVRVVSNRCIRTEHERLKIGPRSDAEKNA